MAIAGLAPGQLLDVLAYSPRAVGEYRAGSRSTWHPLVDGYRDVLAGDLVERVCQRRREVAAAMVELVHLDRELTALEERLTTGAPPTHLCLGKEVST